MERPKAALNRPVFTQRRFESSGLTVLTTLVHRCADPGELALAIRRGGRLIHRSTVRVTAEGSPAQVDIDLASLDGKRGGVESCGCQSEFAPSVRAGGFLAFYVSRGTGRYGVTIVHLGGKEKRVGLDNKEVVPVGDFFAVTLVQPGTYRVSAGEGKAYGEISVAVPTPKDRDYRPDRPALVEWGKGGMKPASLALLAGQSVVVQCIVPAQLVVELTDAASPGIKPAGRRRLTATRKTKRSGGSQTK